MSQAFRSFSRGQRCLHGAKLESPWPLLRERNLSQRFLFNKPANYRVSQLRIHFYRPKCVGEREDKMRRLKKVTVGTNDETIRDTPIPPLTGGSKPVTIIIIRNPFSAVFTPFVVFPCIPREGKRGTKYRVVERTNIGERRCIGARGCEKERESEWASEGWGEGKSERK